jgi:hypothetical protein
MKKSGWRKKQIMNNRDINNLQFLMNASNEEFEQWCLRATPDDYDYALSLFKAKRAIDMMHQLEKPVNDISDAKDILKKYTLKG